MPSASARFPHRIVSLLTLTAFISFALAPEAAAVDSIEALPAQESSFEALLSLPASLGAVEETYRGKDLRTLILIQDAHAIGDAQVSIQKILRYLEEKNIRQVALEGASGAIDSSFFHAFPDKELLETVVAEYLRRGELSGAMAASYLSEKNQSWGVEEQALYEKGTLAYLEALKLQPEFLDKIGKIEALLAALKKKHYSAALKALDEKLEAFEQNKDKSLESLLKALEKAAPLKIQSLGFKKSYPLLQALYSELHAERDETRPQLHQQLKQFAKKIEGKLSGVENKALFHSKKQAYETEAMSPYEYAAFLQELAGSLQLKAPFSARELDRIQQHRLLNRKNNGAGFMKELSAYAREIKAGLYQTMLEQQIDEANGTLSRFHRLAKLELSREDWRNVQRLDSKANQTSEELHRVRDHMDSLQGRLKKDLLPFVEFYRVAESRENAMVEKTLQLLASGNQNAALVAGGFHAEGVAEQLKQKGISFFVISPAIHQMEKENHYLDYMQGKVSWQDYFEVRNGRVDRYAAFAKAVTEKLLEKAAASENNERTVMIKHWRDEIIRTLAARKKITESGKHTRFLDEAASKALEGPKRQTLEKEWLNRVQRFTDGLRGLQRENRLNAENIIRLSTPANVAPATVTHGKIIADAIPSARGRSESRDTKFQAKSFQNAAKVPFKSSPKLDQKFIFNTPWGEQIHGLLEQPQGALARFAVSQDGYYHLYRGRVSPSNYVGKIKTPDEAKIIQMVRDKDLQHIEEFLSKKAAESLTSEEEKALFGEFKLEDARTFFDSQINAFRWWASLTESIGASDLGVAGFLQQFEKIEQRGKALFHHSSRGEIKAYLEPIFSKLPSSGKWLDEIKVLYSTASQSSSPAEKALIDFEIIRSLKKYVEWLAKNTLILHLNAPKEELLTSEGNRTEKQKELDSVWSQLLIRQNAASYLEKNALEVGLSKPQIRAFDYDLNGKPILIAIDVGAISYRDSEKKVEKAWANILYDARFENFLRKSRRAAGIRRKRPGEVIRYTMRNAKEKVDYRSYQEGDQLRNIPLGVDKIQFLEAVAEKVEQAEPIQVEADTLRIRWTAYLEEIVQEIKEALAKPSPSRRLSALFAKDASLTREKARDNFGEDRLAAMLRLIAALAPGVFIKKKETLKEWHPETYAKYENIINQKREHFAGATIALEQSGSSSRLLVTRSNPKKTDEILVFPIEFDQSTLSPSDKKAWAKAKLSASSNVNESAIYTVKSLIDGAVYNARVGKHLNDEWDIGLPVDGDVYSLKPWHISDFPEFEMIKKFAPLPAADVQPNDHQIYQINSRAYLRKYGYKHFDGIPDSELQRISDMGFNMIWFMGAYQESPASRQHNEKWGIINKTPGRVASAYSLLDYMINPDLGGIEAFKRLRDRAEKFGIKLMVDFVPNHFAKDSPLLEKYPEAFIHRTTKPEKHEEGRYFEKVLPDGRVVWFAYASDGWSLWEDVVPLNLLHPTAWVLLAERLMLLASLTRSGGARLDSVHLVHPKVNRQLWSRMPWRQFEDQMRAIALQVFGLEPHEGANVFGTLLRFVKERYPDFVTIGEMYPVHGFNDEKLERPHGPWQQAGVSGTYDKEMVYDTLIKEGLSQKFRDYLFRRAGNSYDADYANRSAHFIGNHDERTRPGKIIGLNGSLKMIVAAMATMPGIPMVYEGEEGGSLIHSSADYISPEISQEQRNPEWEKFYKEIFSKTSHRIFRRGGLAEEIPTEGFKNERLLAFTRSLGDEHAVVVLNDSWQPADVRLDLTSKGLGYLHVKLDPYQEFIEVLRPSLKDKYKQVITETLLKLSNEAAITKGSEKDVLKTLSFVVQREVHPKDLIDGQVVEEFFVARNSNKTVIFQLKFDPKTSRIFWRNLLTGKIENADPQTFDELTKDYESFNLVVKEPSEAELIQVAEKVQEMGRSENRTPQNKPSVKELGERLDSLEEDFREAKKLLEAHSLTEDEAETLVRELAELESEISRPEISKPLGARWLSRIAALEKIAKDVKKIISKKDEGAVQIHALRDRLFQFEKFILEDRQTIASLDEKDKAEKLDAFAHEMEIILEDYIPLQAALGSSDYDEVFETLAREIQEAKASLEKLYNLAGKAREFPFRSEARSEKKETVTAEEEIELIEAKREVLKRNLAKDFRQLSSSAAALADEALESLALETPFSNRLTRRIAGVEIEPVADAIEEKAGNFTEMFIDAENAKALESGERFYKENPDYEEKLTAFLNDYLVTFPEFVRNHFLQKNAEPLAFNFAVRFSENKAIQNWLLEFPKRVEKAAQSYKVSANIRILATQAEIKENPEFFGKLHPFMVESIELDDSKAVSQLNMFLNTHPNALVYGLPDRFIQKGIPAARVVELDGITSEEAFGASILINKRTAGLSEITAERLRKIHDTLPAGVSEFSPNGRLVLLEKARSVILQAFSELAFSRSA